MVSDDFVLRTTLRSYEEYHPFGTSSYRAKSGIEVSEKRYRYIGKERDEGTGLYYMGARYYVAWLGRWTRPDPAGLVDGPGRYSYVRNTRRAAPTCASSRRSWATPS